MKPSPQAVPNTDLRRQRVRRHWTQTELARMLGTTYLSVCRWEQGTTTPSLHFRKQLCEVFGLPPEDLGLAPAPPETIPSVQDASSISLEERSVPDLSPFVMRTRCRPPRLRADVLSRPRLLQIVQRTLENRGVVLLSAPAGSGKTTLLSAFQSRHPDMPVAWLTLDDEDNDPICLLHELIVALQRLHTGIGATALSMLDSPAHPGIESKRLVNVLLMDVEEMCSEPGILILDDLHVLTHSVAHEVVQTLVESLPPTLRLLIATRYEPPLSLSRLRAQRLVQELRLEDLRFTEEEVQQFLTGTMNMMLAPDQIHLVSTCTQGWAAGLGLLTSSFSRLPLASEKTALLTHLGLTQHCIFDFLTEEVFQHQEAVLQSFLVHTCILPELTPTLCQEVTDDPDASAHLVTLYRRNLFLTVRENEAADPSSHDRLCYRYHDLFRHFLQIRLARTCSQEQIRRLHLRAAHAEQLPARRFQHFLTAHAWEEAAQAIAQVGESSIEQGLLIRLYE